MGLSVPKNLLSPNKYSVFQIAWERVANTLSRPFIISKYMRTFFLLTGALCLTASICVAQKEDANWILGSTLSSNSNKASVQLSFLDDSLQITYKDKRVGFSLASSTISSPDGKLIAGSNGVQIFDNQLEIIENGENLHPEEDYPIGLPITQSMIMLPANNGKKEILLLTGKFITFTSSPRLDPISFTLIDYSGDRPLVTVKNEILLKDTIHPQGTFTAVKHANGRDWWLPLLKSESNSFFMLLIRNGQPEVFSRQTIGDIIPTGWDHTVFSPDGQWYIRYSWWGTTWEPYSSIYLYHFDRCSGELSDFKKYQLKDNGPGGVAVSPNSRYLYVSNWDTIFQYDLHAPDIFSTETIVARYEGFIGEDGWPVRFFTPQLAPDGRIYLCVPNQLSRYLHYIQYPDSAGMACKVVQHGVHLPVYNSFTLPNLPYFRLYEDRSSPCDTIGKSQPVVYETLQITPNPGDSQAWVHLPADGFEQETRLCFFDAAGKLVFEQSVPVAVTEVALNLEWLPAGLYFYQLDAGEQGVYRGKWVKGL